MNLDSVWTLWFWITHVIAWSMASHFALGVPYDMVLEAQRKRDGHEDWEQASEAMILAQVFRFVSYSRRFGPSVVGVSMFIVSALLTLATMADMEFARALLTLFGPLILIYIFTIRTALRIDAAQDRGEALFRRLKIQRLINQFIGLIAIASAVMLAIFEAVDDLTVF